MVAVIGQPVPSRDQGDSPGDRVRSPNLPVIAVIGLIGR
jgi:hypothetical protein